jgi:dihydrofolate reductase
MRKIALLAHISLDGFVAGVNGELDGFDQSEENLQFVCNLTETADAALFGRISYELLNNYWPTAKDRPNASSSELAYSAWYNNATKIVVSKTMASHDIPPRTMVITENVADGIAKIKSQPGKDILLFGSPSVTQLLMLHELIDSYWIFVNPAIFGSGIPLFNRLTKNIKLKLETSKEFPNGELVLNYTVKMRKNFACFADPLRPLRPNFFARKERKEAQRTQRSSTAFEKQLR